MSADCENLTFLKVVIFFLKKLPESPTKSQLHGIFFFFALEEKLPENLQGCNIPIGSDGNYFNRLNGVVLIRQQHIYLQFNLLKQLRY